MMTRTVLGAARARLLLGVLGWAAATATVLSGDVQQRERSAPRFFARADLVTLPVTVTDQRDKYVADLDARNFQIFENGRPQSLEFFQSTAAPLTLTLVLDTSASVKTTLPAITEGAVGFIHDLDPDDVVSVIGFNDHVRVLQEFTNDHDALNRAIRGAQLGSSTSFYNAVYVALKELERADLGEATTPRRRVLLVLSDGADNASLMPFEDVLETAAATDIAIYAIRLAEQLPITDSSSDHIRFLLRRLTEDTGGRAFFPVTLNDVVRAYKAIRSELAHQYVLAYVSTDRTRSPRFHQLSVIVERPGVVARTRRGYFSSAR
jgi:VWFA-related protein